MVRDACSNARVRQVISIVPMSAHLAGVRAKAWCLLIHAEASLSYAFTHIEPFCPKHSHMQPLSKVLTLSSLRTELKALACG
jgi:hypothetical protein